MSTTTTQHTPGEWRVSENSHGLLCIWHDPNDTRHFHDHIPVPSESEEGKANARLIAAAPELLAALKELAGECLDMTERYDEEDVVGSPFRLALKDAIAAIAQAERT